MYTATIPITIVNFTPIGSGNIEAKLLGPNDTSPNAPTGVFSGSGEDLLVTTPEDYTGAVQVTFQLPQPGYVLVGIAVVPQGSGGSSGRREFRTVILNRDPSGSQMTVTDACVPKNYGVDFDYLILVQEISSGFIGLIDPDDENEPE